MFINSYTKMMANDVKDVLIFLAVCFKKSHTMSQMLFDFHCIDKKKKRMKVFQRRKSNSVL